MRDSYSSRATITTWSWPEIHRRINSLLQDVSRHGNEGIGKPEPLKHGFQARVTITSSRSSTTASRVSAYLARDSV
ncbi:type II toxin-antitoxin system YoeB family toxin [Streptomyces sp. NPDC004623]|uniref:type II toxin-antitoxin system YoeB family toxin n=1 Tax=Streptomyces sp. NPDC004623 TaxID=3156653 RepID=UPI0033AB05E6